MSNWNPLETTLRSWTPREPSPKLKARLFAPADGVSASLAAAGEDLPFSWQWLAPSMALVLIATFLLGHQSGVLGLSSATSPELFVAAALPQPGRPGQPDLSTYYISARHSENNTPVVGVEGTNGSFAMGGAPTNHLMH